MRNRSKLFLFFINIFLFMFLFEQSVSSLSIQNNTKNIKCLNENEQVNNNSKVIYLTFDDGPSNKITNKVLDILKENDVKATFF
ncbi:peptidoglycan/xylan/chitin deacetylase (PgdA/CDA1 family) [Clostridium saccharobutylicum]|nr:peptidoglycan/xylan/chitin deacetylase (PgdA/CDA1 family) [Clostridium saccharobutylicum]